MKSRLKESLSYYYCRQSAEDPVQGQPGIESKWLFWDEWDIGRKPLLVCDVSAWGSSEDIVQFLLPPGRYELRARVISFGRDRRVSRFRVAPENARTRRGKEIKTLPVDAGAMAVIDGRALRTLLRDDKPQEYEALLNDYKERGFGTAFFGDRTGSVGILSTGFGDGNYPIFELLDESGAVCGIEIVFLEAKAAYPFSVQPSASPERIADEQFHWSQIEHLWDSAWESMKVGDTAAREFFDSLTKGERALLALDIFNKIVLRFGMRGFFLADSSRVVAEDVRLAYQILGAKEYENRSQKVLALAPSEPDAKIFKMDFEGFRQYLERHQKVISEFEAWFREAMSARESGIEVIIRRYVESHPTEFTPRVADRGRA